MADDFKRDFKNLTGHPPFPWQERLFEAFKAGEVPSACSLPTGLGKTSIIAIWLIAVAHGAKLPRRLVYCLPMRVLVEQTRGLAKLWSERCGATLDQPTVPVHVLMGGESEDDWDIQPEGKAVIIGTQDMLLSRALNRGYAASRARWPMQFGLLHTDCLWIFDEIQLMGSGLTTTTQLDAFRYLLGLKDGHGCKSLWMSATLRTDWLSTVDFKDRIDEQGRIDGKDTFALDVDVHENVEVKKRWNAKKQLAKAVNLIDAKNPKALAEEIVYQHEKVKGRTIVVVNTVDRARNLFEAIKKKWRPAAADKNLILIHSRFRPPEREAQIRKLKAETSPGQLPAEGMIVVSTQVVEAGVDVSATTLFTEIAPWAPLVQRFGRCNRRGEENERASVRWIDVPTKEADAMKAALPYKLSDLRAASVHLKKLEDVGLGSLAVHGLKLNQEEQATLFPHEHTHVIRRKDLIDLFDTTPDLAGNDIDIDRFVREIDETDVRVFWRNYGQTPNGTDAREIESAPHRDELCPAPIGEFREFTKSAKGKVWRWDFLEMKWTKADEKSIIPGQVFLVHSDSGGYSVEEGWQPKKKEAVAPVDVSSSPLTLEATDDEPFSRIGVWQSLTDHTDEVCRELDVILSALSLSEDDSAALRIAARWHDWGKAHELFQSALPVAKPDPSFHWAKAVGDWKRYSRPHFRHELASALAVLQRPHEELRPLSDDVLNLVSYLIASHHGKVRLSIRSMPNEHRPTVNNGAPRKRFARGVWDGDELPEADLGGGVTAPRVTLSLEPMELGLGEGVPLECFKDQPSWVERVLRLRDTLGPFRLAHLEALLRAADMRASKAAEPRPPKILSVGAPVGRGDGS